METPKLNDGVEIGRVVKQNGVDVVIRVDAYKGNLGITIREFNKSDKYEGFTKHGTRIPLAKFQEFKDYINSIDVSQLLSMSATPKTAETEQKQ